MRHLSTALRRRITRGLTLVELMVTLAVIGLMVTFAGPQFSDFLTNTRMREGAHSVLAQALFAQSEALKRNTPVRLTVTTAAATVTVVSTGEVLRSQALTDGLSATNGAINFGANGLPTPLGSSLSVVVAQGGVTCSLEMRCPTLTVDGGGGMRICSNTSSCP